MKRKMPHYISLAALLVTMCCYGCGLTSPDKETLAPVMPASMFVEHEGHFCDGSGKDKFTVGYFGTDPLDTLVYLYIVCHQKDTVYEAAYPGKWFLENANAGTDSANVARVHSKMRALAEGKLMPPLDSFEVAVAGSQPLFGIDLPGHLQSVLYYSQADHKVHELY
jgi:hypothetical protein